jgi:hypothetical protein
METTKPTIAEFAQTLHEKHGSVVLKKSIIMEEANAAGFDDREMYNSIVQSENRANRGQYTIAKYLSSDVQESQASQEIETPEGEDMPVEKCWELEGNKIVKTKPSYEMTHDEWVEYNIAYQNHRRQMKLEGK